MADGKQVVLVTGASGCLGQHIVKLLQEQDKNVTEIRCFDLKPYTNNLGHKTNKPMKIITGDIRNEKTVVEALNGVNVVIHCAAIVDVSQLFPDEQSLKSVNVDGTSVLIDASVENNVPYFVHISSIDVVVGDDSIYYGAENTTPIPNKHILGPYSTTKREAEAIVAKANGRILANGSDKLRTAIMRPTLLYGEEDHHFLTEILKIAKTHGGFLRRIDNVFIRCQPIYAGNAAWAAIKAKDKLQHDESIGGEDFFVTDDTAILDPFDFLKPYLECRGFKLTNRAYPFWLFILLFYFFALFIKLIRPIYEIKLTPGITPGNVKYICNTYFYNRNKAILRLDYEPFYTPEEAQENAISYYKKLDLK